MEYRELDLQSSPVEKGVDTVSKTMTATIVLRNDSSNNWSKVEETMILSKGEPAIEFTPDGSTKMKIGNGIDFWKDLPYISGNTGTVDIDFSNLTWGQLANKSSDEQGYYTEELGFGMLGYGDKVDIEVINSNTELVEQHLVEISEQISTLNTDLNTNKSAIEEQKNTINSFDSKIQSNTDKLNEIENNKLKDLEQRTSTIEGDMHHVDYLIGELTNGLEGVDAPLELIDMRVDISGNTFDSAGAHVRAIEHDIEQLKDNLSDYVDIVVPDGLIYEGNKLYLSHNGEAISEPVEIVGGSGGGGNSGSFSIDLITDPSCPRQFSVTKEDQVILKFHYSSEDRDGYKDGGGICAITNNGQRILSFVAPQGLNEIDITNYLVTDTNDIVIRITNTEGNSRSLTYQIEVVALRLSTTLPSLSICEGDTNFDFTISGIGNKKVYFYLDGRDLGVETVSGNTATRQKKMPKQADGPHYLRMYSECYKDGVTVRTQELVYGLLWKSSTTTFPLIMFNYQNDSLTQGEAIAIPYIVYDPYHLASAKVTYNIYKEDGTLYYTRSGNVEPVSKVWYIQDYPSGRVKFEIVCEQSSNSLEIDIEPSSFNKEIIRDALEMEFTAQNRSNADDNKEEWSYGPYKAEFSNNFAWTDVDGWVTDSKGGAVLRFLPGNNMKIPFKPFSTDIRSSGYTIEIELASHNVRNYESVLVASYEDERGFIVKSQSAMLKSQSSGTSVQFKEDERIRITFVIAKYVPNSLNNLIYIYINGILCSVTPYPDDDNFLQSDPSELYIGAEDCGLDLYSLRFYSRAFNAVDQLNNFICDRSTIAERIAVDKRNDIIDNANTENVDDIVISFDKVKSIIPVMIMRCAKLPADKDNDKFKGCHVDYIDELHPEYSFSADNCTFSVQGTSSSKYPVKNFKIKLGSGITYTESGETAKGWLFDKENSIETKVFCLKADFASSEHSNNVDLVDFYNDTTPFKMPAQIVNEKVRQGVNGRPIVLFWENSETGELSCQGSYNLNDDKSNEKTFGFVDVDVTSIIPEPRIECWEWCNNGNPICLFQNTEAFDQTKIDPDTKKEYPAWHDDLEPRFPDLDDHYYGDEPGELDGIRPLIEWVASTNPLAATGEQFEEARSYPHYLKYAFDKEEVKYPIFTSFTHDNVDYRLSKFKYEFNQYFFLDPILFYYLFTEVFHLMDSRAKNMFLTTFDGKHYFPIPYDMDTAMGINNEGTLTYDYNCEDHERQDDKGVFTGQESVLWNNVRDCFSEELNLMYRQLRADPEKPFSYEEYARRANEHQQQWSETCWNYDAQFKYLNTYEQGYPSLAALQGNKKAQREWWLYNAFKYRDSKYGAGDSKSRILIRTNGQGTLRIKPYSHIYAEVEWGEQGTERKRAYRDEYVDFNTPEGASKVENLETHIFSADRIADIGDLSPLFIGYCDVGEAVKLQRLILGNSDPNYRNGMLTNVIVKNNTLLREIDVTNCYNLGRGSQQGDLRTLNASTCPCLEIFRGKGTALEGVSFSNGGHLKEVRLPGTITSLVLRNQKLIETLDIESYDNIRTLGLTNIPNMNIEELVLKMPKLDRIALENVQWKATDEETLLTMIDKLSKCNGLKVDGTTLVGEPILTGRVEIDEISDEALEKINLKFPSLVVVVAGIPKFFIRYRNYYGDPVYTYVANEGDSAIDPTNPPEGWPHGAIAEPEVPDTEDTRLIWKGWNNLPTSIKESHDIVAIYDGEYRVQFYDVNKKLYEKATQWVKHGNSAKEPVENRLISAPTCPSTEETNYTFIGWDRDYTNIVGPEDFYPVFQETRRQYTCDFYNGDKYLGSSKVFYNEFPILPPEIDIDNIYKEFNGEISSYYDHIGWEPSLEEKITKNTVFQAQFLYTEYIEDDWETIIENCKNGNTSNYDLGGRKKLTLTLNDINYEVEMEIVGKNHDILTTPSNEYNSGSNKACLSFICKNLINKTVAATANMSREFEGFTGYTVGGWEDCLLREWMHTTLLSSLPLTLRNNIKTVNKLADCGSVGITTEGYKQLRRLRESHDLIWAPSARELGRELLSENVEGQGEPYPIFTDDISRIKYVNETAKMYWTRTTPGWNNSFATITSRGEQSRYTSSNSINFAFGFCL